MVEFRLTFRFRPAQPCFKPEKPLNHAVKPANALESRASVRESVKHCHFPVARRTIAAMPTFQVKTESLAIRCEVCHQADLFEPVTGVCSRCSGIQTNPADQESAPSLLSLGPHLEYTGPRVFKVRRHLRNIVWGGVVGALLPTFFPALALLFSEGFDGDLLELVFLAFGSSFIPGAFSGFWVGRSLHHLSNDQTLAKLRESGALPAVLATIGLMLQVMPVFCLRNGVESVPETLRIFLQGTFLMSFMNGVGGLLVSDCLTFLERKNLRVLRN